MKFLLLCLLSFGVWAQDQVSSEAECDADGVCRTPMQVEDPEMDCDPVSKVCRGPVEVAPSTPVAVEDVAQEDFGQSHLPPTQPPVDETIWMDEASKDKAHCLEARRKQLFSKPRSFAEVVKTHDTEWNQSNKDCAAILEVDRQKFFIVYGPVHKPVYGPEYKPLKKVFRPKPLNYRPNTCRWVEDLPRKVLVGPKQNNCKDETRVCTGYVMCDPVRESAPKVVRMSTCHPDNCHKDGAVECTKQKFYHSKEAKGSKGSVSENIKTAIGVK